MSRENKIQLFGKQSVRTHWDEEQEKWYFSVQDIVQILSESRDVKQYIKKIRSRNSELNTNWGTICTPVEMIAADGRKRKIQATDTAGILRIIQSIPSSKAEPFKLWLAKVGSERIDEMEDPELSFDRAMETYLAKGYSKEWINQRLKSIEVRKELTDVRDNMSNLELVLNMLAEASTTEISREKKPQGLDENKDIARKGGTAAKKARVEIEKQTGKPIITSKNAENLLSNDCKVIENE
ncbi:MAG: phage antirepressor protein [Bacteroidetes bacterium]|nr:phage antirepressor protein [Bacteroidota bacterium]